MTPFGRFVTDSFGIFDLTMADILIIYIVFVLETVGLAPPGTGKVSKVLNLGADSLVLAGELELFTPMFFFLAEKTRKPE